MSTSLIEQDLGYRKIQRTGRESYIISLPKDWILEVGLNKGDQLAFQKQEDSSLLLIPRKLLEGNQRTEPSQKEFTVSITPKDDPQSIARRIRSLYEVSADLIHIRFREGGLTSEQKASIRSTVRMLLGSEIIVESPREISIQTLIEHPNFPIEKAIRRMFVIAKSMDLDAIASLKDMDMRRIQGVIDSDEDLDRLGLYVVRQLKYGIELSLSEEMGLRSPKEFLGYRIVTKNLVNIGDNAKETANNILFLKRLIDDAILTLTQPIDEEVSYTVIQFNSIGHRLLEDALKALFKRDYRLADETISKYLTTCVQLEKDAINLILYKGLDPNVAVVLRLILDNARKMMEYSREIADVTLNRTVEEITAT